MRRVTPPVDSAGGPTWVWDRTEHGSSFGTPSPSTTPRRCGGFASTHRTVAWNWTWGRMTFRTTWANPGRCGQARPASGCDTGIVRRGIPTATGVPARRWSCRVDSNAPFLWPLVGSSEWRSLRSTTPDGKPWCVWRTGTEKVHPTRSPCLIGATSGFPSPFVIRVNLGALCPGPRVSLFLTPTFRGWMPKPAASASFARASHRVLPRSSRFWPRGTRRGTATCRCRQFP